jgi:DNA-binding CsgD family transcriptional regulator
VNKNEEMLQALIRENIKGVVTKKDLKQWFLDVQNEQHQGFCMSLTCQELYKMAEENGIKVIDKGSAIEIIKPIPPSREKQNKTQFKFSRGEFIELYMNSNLTQADIARRFRVAPNKVREAVEVFGLPERPMGPKKTSILTRELLYDLYVKQGLSKSEIAEFTGKTVGTISNRLCVHKLLRRNEA